jgi:hypothetical protein
MTKLQSMLHDTFVPDWLVGCALVGFAILCALIVHQLARSVTRRVIGARRSLAVLILEATSGPTRLALCLAAVAFVLPLAPLGDDLRTTSRICSWSPPSR